MMIFQGTFFSFENMKCNRAKTLKEINKIVYIEIYIRKPGGLKLEFYSTTG